MSISVYPINKDQLHGMIRQPANKYQPKEWRNSFCSNPPVYFSPMPNREGVRRPKLFYPFKKNSNFDYADTDYSTTEKKFTFKNKNRIEALSCENKRKANMIRTDGFEPTKLYKKMHKDTLSVACSKIQPINRFKNENDGSEGKLDEVVNNDSILTSTSERPYSNFAYGLGLTAGYTRDKRNAQASPGRISLGTWNKSQTYTADYTPEIKNKFSRNVLDSTGNKFTLNDCDNAAFVEEKFSAIKNKFLDDGRSTIRNSTRSAISYRIGGNNERSLNGRNMDLNQNLSSVDRYSKKKPVENVDFNAEDPHKVNINNWEFNTALKDKKCVADNYRIKAYDYNGVNLRPKTHGTPNLKVRRRVYNAKNQGQINYYDNDNCSQKGHTETFDDKELKDQRAKDHTKTWGEKDT